MRNDHHGSPVEASTTLYRKLFSAEAKDFTSENAEVLAAVDLIRAHTQGRGIWTMDRGGDRKKLLEPLLDRSQRFVIRSAGKRTVIDRKGLQGSVTEVAGRCRLRHQARIIKIQDGQEKSYELRYGAEPIRLPGREEQLWLVVVAGFGEEPLMLLTNLPIRAKRTPLPRTQACQPVRRRGCAGPAPGGIGRPAHSSLQLRQ